MPLSLRVLLLTTKARKIRLLASLEGSGLEKMEGLKSHGSGGLRDRSKFTGYLAVLWEKKI